MRLVLMSKLLGRKKMMSMLLVAWVAFALAASPQVNSDSVQLSQKLGDRDGDKGLGSDSFRSLKLADGDLLRYRMDWQRGIITLMAEAKPQSALKVDFAAAMSQAWEQGLSDFYQLSRYLYHEYYGEFPVVSSGPTERTRAQTASFESEKNRAADRASRHVFSSLSQFRSDGSVGLHLSARLAAVLSDVRVVGVGGDAPQLSDTQEGGGMVVAFRFLCAVQPLPYLVVRYGGEEVYAPSLMSRAAYEQQLMGTWLQDASYDIRSYLERIWQRSTASRPKRWLQLALQCSDDSRTFDGVSSAEWESLSVEDKRRWAWSGWSFFLW